MKYGVDARKCGLTVESLRRVRLSDKILDLLTEPANQNSKVQVRRMVMLPLLVLW
jgi:hypothetical protein